MSLGGGPECTICKKTVYFADQVVIDGQLLHKLCCHCSKCGGRLDAGNGVHSKGDFKCSRCARKEFDTKPKMAQITGTATDATDACPKCGKKVYMAEEVRAVGKKFHKSCFTCCSCNGHLDSTTLCNKDNAIYCKSCYAKEHGPKGYGYGQGAGALPFTK